MRPVTGNTSVIQYQNRICILNRRNALCDNDFCRIRNFFPERFANQGIGFCIDGAR